jgi:hypothetical protein
VEDQSERPIPFNQIEFDGLSCLNQPHCGGHGEHRRQTGKNSQYSLRSSGTESRYEYLQRGTQQERAWRNQNQGCCCHA